MPEDCEYARIISESCDILPNMRKTASCLAVRIIICNCAVTFRDMQRFEHDGGSLNRGLPITIGRRDRGWACDKPDTYSSS